MFEDSSTNEELVVFSFRELVAFWRERGGLLNDETLDRVLRKYDIPALRGQHKMSYKRHMGDRPFTQYPSFGERSQRDLKFTLADVHRFEDDHREVMATLGVAPRPMHEEVPRSDLKEPESRVENQAHPSLASGGGHRANDPLADEFISCARQNPVRSMNSPNVETWCQQAALAVNQKQKATKQQLYDALLASGVLKGSYPSRSLFFGWLGEVNDQNPEDRRWKGRGRPLGSRKSKKQ